VDNRAASDHASNGLKIFLNATPTFTHALVHAAQDRQLLARVRHLSSPHINGVNALRTLNRRKEEKTLTNDFNQNSVTFNPVCGAEAPKWNDDSSNDVAPLTASLSVCLSVCPSVVR